MKTISVLIGLLLIVSCATVRVNYDYDKATDFADYTTYSYYPDMETGLSGLDEKRMLVIVDSIMQVKGLLYSEEPDFHINIQSSSFKVLKSFNQHKLF